MSSDFYFHTDFFANIFPVCGASQCSERLCRCHIVMSAFLTKLTSGLCPRTPDIPAERFYCTLLFASLYRLLYRRNFNREMRNIDSVPLRKNIMKRAVISLTIKSGHLIFEPFFRKDRGGSAERQKCPGTDIFRPENGAFRAYFVKIMSNYTKIR